MISFNNSLVLCTNGNGTGLLITLLSFLHEKRNTGITKSNEYLIRIFYCLLIIDFIFFNLYKSYLLFLLLMFYSALELVKPFQQVLSNVFLFFIIFLKLRILFL